MYSNLCFFIFFMADCLFMTLLAIIGCCDYKKKIIPNKLNGLILLLGVLMLIISILPPFARVIADSERIITLAEDSFFEGGILSRITIEIISLPDRILGLFVLSVPLILIRHFYQGSFGMGDVKFLACTGFYMGWKNLIIGTFTGSSLAAVICIISILRHRLSLKDKIAFGPYLCVGMACVTLSGWFV